MFQGKFENRGKHRCHPGNSRYRKLIKVWSASGKIENKHFGHFSVMLSSIIFDGSKIKDSSALESFVCFFLVFLSVSISTPYTVAKTKNNIKFDLMRKLLQ